MANESQGVGILKIGEGNALKLEGEVEDKLPLPAASPGFTIPQLKLMNVNDFKPDPSHLPKEVVFEANQGTSKDGPFHPVGDTVNYR